MVRPSLLLSSGANAASRCSHRKLPRIHLFQNFACRREWLHEHGLARCSAKAPSCATIPKTVRRAQCVFSPRRHNSHSRWNPYAVHVTLISPQTRCPIHFFRSFPVPNCGDYSTNSCPGPEIGGNRGVSPRPCCKSASRTRTSAHPGRSFGAGFTTKRNFPFST
jgi:hypothetical protein